MTTTAPEISLDQRAALRMRQPIKWGVVASVFVCGCLVIVAGYWFRQTTDTAAAYKAYHRAKVEFELGRASLSELCGASRRCCIAQCRVPRLGKSAPLQAHLARIDAARPATVVKTETGEKTDDQDSLKAWQVFHDEAALWIALGKPK